MKNIVKIRNSYVFGGDYNGVYFVKTLGNSD